MYRDTVTLFNRKRDKTGDVWYPTVIRGVHLETGETAEDSRFGQTGQDRAWMAWI